MDQPDHDWFGFALHLFCGVLLGSVVGLVVSYLSKLLGYCLPLCLDLWGFAVVFGTAAGIGRHKFWTILVPGLLCMMAVYLSSVARAFIMIQSSGLVLATVIIWLARGRTSDIIVLWICEFPTIMLAGLLVTIIPTVLYSLALPGLIICMRKFWLVRKWHAYLAAAILTSVTWAVVSRRFPGMDGFRDPYVWAFFMIAIGAGLLGARSVFSDIVKKENAQPTDPPDPD